MCYHELYFNLNRMKFTTLFCEHPIFFCRIFQNAKLKCREITYFSWTAKLKCSEIRILALTAKLKCREMQFLEENNAKLKWPRNFHAIQVAILHYFNSINKKLPVDVYIFHKAATSKSNTFTGDILIRFESC